MTPVIIPEKCIKCGKCMRACVSKAIDIDTFDIDENKCIVCLHCTAVCPNKAISYDSQFGEEIDFSKIDFSNFENLVYKRRSVRLYKEKPVPEEMINKITGLLRYAPTGTNTQRVFVTIVASRERMKEFSDKTMSFFNLATKILFNAVTYPFWRIIAGKIMVKRLYGFKKFIKRYFEGEDVLTYNAPCLFIFHAPIRSSTPSQDCSIWSTTGVLYAESLGLGTCFNGFVVLALSLSGKLKRSLGIKPGHKVYSSFLLGYPDVNFLRGVVREETKVNVIR